MDCLIDPSTMTLKIPKLSPDVEEMINSGGIHYTIENGEVVIKGNNYIDFVGRFNVSGEIIKYIPNCLVTTVRKADDEAIVPFKTRMSDVGLDLTIIKKHKDVRKNVIMYDTGIKIEIPVGFYAEVVARSSLIKTGWILANSIGIIDNTYTGNIYIVVAKIDPDADDLQLPYNGFQLIIKKQYFPLINLSSKDLPITDRSDGGFGSTSAVKNTGD